MKNQLRRATSRTVRSAMRGLPGPVVQRMVQVWAPLARYGGSSRGGALALSRAISVLAEPPLSLRPGGRLLSVADLAVQLTRPEDELERWVRWGLLGEPEQPASGGKPALWGEAGIERARLIDYLRHHGVSELELRQAHAQHRLPLLVLDRTVSGRPTMTLAEVSRRTGVSPEFTTQVWRALGLPPGEPDEVVYTRHDLEGLRILAAMRTIFSDDDLIEATSVLGLAMSQVASAQVELFRRRLGSTIGGVAANLDYVLRSAAMVELMLPTAGQLMEQVHRRHIEAAVRGESIAAVEQATGTLPGQVELCVGFADLVGFTAASELLAPLELGEMAGALVHHAEASLPGYGARIVKTIGDAVMFTVPDAASACAAALDLVDDAATDRRLPPLRIGLAYGPVLRRYGDCFGRTVNIASRLCAAAAPGAVLLHSSTAVDTEALARRGIAAGPPETLVVKGIEGGVVAVRVSRTGRP